MTAEMIVAIGSLVAGIAGIISAILLYRKTVALLEYRMAIVEKKLDEHNGYADKFSQIQTDVAVIKTKVDLFVSK